MPMIIIIIYKINRYTINCLLLLLVTRQKFAIKVARMAIGEPGEILLLLCTEAK